MSDVAERVAKGVELLDDKVPGWRDRVNATVSVASTSNCILGQLYGNYWTGTRRLGIGGFFGSGADYGFNGKIFTHDGMLVLVSYAEDCENLTEEWHRVLGFETPAPPPKKELFLV